MSTGDPKHLLHPHPGLRPWLEGGAPAITPGRLKPGSQGIRARPSGTRPSSLSSPDQRPPRALCRQRPLSGIVGEGPRGSPGARREVRNPHEGSLVPLRVSDQRIENEDEEGRLGHRVAKSLPLVLLFRCFAVECIWLKCAAPDPDKSVSIIVYAPYLPNLKNLELQNSPGSTVSSKGLWELCQH